MTYDEIVTKVEDGLKANLVNRTLVRAAVQDIAYQITNQVAARKMRYNHGRYRKNMTFEEAADLVAKTNNG